MKQFSDFVVLPGESDLLYPLVGSVQVKIFFPALTRIMGDRAFSINYWGGGVLRDKTIDD